MNILVTGATGTVGKHVVQQLIDKKLSVRAVSRNPRSAQLPHRAEVVYGDLMQPETMRQALHNIDAMYLILSSDVAGADLETDAQIITLAEEAGVKQVSLLTVYGDGLVEQALRNSTMTSTFVQPVGFMANCSMTGRTPFVMVE
ncbi:SDR family oxidoreductase [Geomicrobium sp. JCM 19039]|uniref:SDR family oxidoreductase n=1 Tax=Geomicrobium sp. JCM 19039 TaxID=1460636 RepID=UPI00045F4BFE|nr:NAD(P)H-binding protein [Geomicrobium sp. JCM 19039]GAK13998.1 oxidoreductase [Geomicrobium sp. JCM 19039]